MNTLHGCHNRAPFKVALLVQDGWTMLPPDGFGIPSKVPRWKEIPFRNNPNCEYTHSEAGRVDQKCDGCRWAAGLLQAAAQEAVPA